MGNNGHGKLPPNIPILQTNFKKKCYICERDVLVPPAAKNVGIVTCPQCETEKNVFILNLFKQSRAQFIKLQEQQAAQKAEGLPSNEPAKPAE